MPGFKSPHGAQVDYKESAKPNPLQVTKQGEGELISNLPSSTGGGVDSKVVTTGPREGSMIEMKAKKGTGDTGLEKFTEDFSLIK